MNQVFNINHIAICMCNSLKCWFKHPPLGIIMFDHRKLQTIQFNLNQSLMSESLHGTLWVVPGTSSAWEKLTVGFALESKAKETPQ